MKQSNSETSRIADLYSAVWVALEYWSGHAKNDYQAGIIYGLRIALDNINKIFPEVELETPRKVRVKSQIRTVEDVRVFFHDLFREGLAIHPDNNFHECVKPEWGISTETLDRLNSLMAEAHSVCEEESVDIYEIAWGEYNMDKLQGFK